MPALRGEASTLILRIDKIFTAWDMRARWELRNHRSAQKLQRGHCIVAFNRSETIARIITKSRPEGAEHNYYAPVGSKFDLDLLSDMMEHGIGVELKNGQHAAAGRRLRKAA